MEKLSNLFKNHLALVSTGLVIPIALILVGGVAKKLVRGRGWERKDFFFGIELSLSAMSGAVTTLFTPPSGVNPTPEISTKLAMFIIVCFGLFMVVLSLHQDFQDTTPPNPKNEYIYLIGLSNIIGIALMFLLVVWIQAA